MSKIYLQEKISGNKGDYVVVGSNGYLTSGPITMGTLPTINITVPVGATNVTALYEDGVSHVEVVSTGVAAYRCSPTKFGVWTVSCSYSGGSLTDTISVETITSYSVELL